MVATRHSARYLTALLLTPLLLLSGCGKFNAGFVIKDENHVDATLTVGVLKSVLDEFAGSEAEEVAKELRDCSELKKSYELDENAADKMTIKPCDADASHPRPRVVRNRRPHLRRVLRATVLSSSPLITTRSGSVLMVLVSRTPSLGLAPRNWVAQPRALISRSL